jgi:hypothetical protein
VACLEPMLSRRQLLAASPAALPLFLALSGCQRPAALSAPPPLPDRTVMLLHAVTAEQNLIALYRRAASAHAGLGRGLAPLLAEHQAHLDQLRSRVIEPPGHRVPGPAATAPAIAATPDGALRQLRRAEQTAVATLLSRLGGASPSLAQLYASIAAAESTHVIALARQIGA